MLAYVLGRLALDRCKVSTSNLYVPVQLCVHEHNRRNLYSVLPSPRCQTYWPDTYLPKSAFLLCSGNRRYGRVRLRQYSLN